MLHPPVGTPALRRHRHPRDRSRLPGPVLAAAQSPGASASTPRIALAGQLDGPLRGLPGRRGRRAWLAPTWVRPHRPPVETHTRRRPRGRRRACAPRRTTTKRASPPSTPCGCSGRGPAPVRTRLQRGWRPRGRTFPRTRRGREAVRLCSFLWGFAGGLPDNRHCRDRRMTARLRPCPTGTCPLPSRTACGCSEKRPSPTLPAALPQDCRHVRAVPSHVLDHVDPAAVAVTPCSAPDAEFPGRRGSSGFTPPGQGALGRSAGTGFPSRRPCAPDPAGGRQRPRQHGAPSPSTAAPSVS